MKLMKQWVSKQGQSKAIMLLMDATGLGLVTIDKIMRNKYKSEISMLAKKAISEVMHIPEKELFREKS